MDKKDLAFPLKVKTKIQETLDTFSLVLEIPDTLKEKFKYKAGQFVSFFLDINGKDVSRSYSLSSSPDVDSDFKITVKRVTNGLVSNYLIDDIKEGDQLLTTPPAGLFCLPKDQSANEFVFFAAGSGITPMMSLLKSAIHKSDKNRCHLLFGSRDEDSVIFHRELKDINSKHPDQFRYEYILSQPKKAFDGMTGRLHGPQVKEFLERGSCTQAAYYYLCGPEGFMSTIEAALEIYGISRDHIIKESFNIPTANNAYKDELDGAVLIGNQELAAKPKKLIVELDGETHELDAIEGQSILETLLENGKNPPYSCMDGGCMACMGKVTEGLVYQDDMGILTEDNTEIGECLTCQAKPASEVLKVSYEI